MYEKCLEVIKVRKNTSGRVNRRQWKCIWWKQEDMGPNTHTYMRVCACARTHTRNIKLYLYVYTHIYVKLYLFIYIYAYTHYTYKISSDIFIIRELQVKTIMTCFILYTFWLAKNLTSGNTKAKRKYG